MMPLQNGITSTQRLLCLLIVTINVSLSVSFALFQYQFHLPIILPIAIKRTRNRRSIYNDRKKLECHLYYDKIMQSLTLLKSKKYSDEEEQVLESSRNIHNEYYEKSERIIDKNDKTLNTSFILKHVKEQNHQLLDNPFQLLSTSQQQNRRLFFSSILTSSVIPLLGTTSTLFMSPLIAYADEIKWSPSPINKRSGVTVYQAEETYNIQFITYLARFLLSFDEECQKWWYKRAITDIPKTASSDQVQSMRLKQFASFAASVEVGLQAFEDTNPPKNGDTSNNGENDNIMYINGPRRLMASLLKRYGQDQDDSDKEGIPKEKIKSEIKEAKRQIALLFGLLKTYQPVDDITKLLAAIDNASIRKVKINNHGSGYAPGYGVPAVTFPPPEAGEEYETATGRATLRPNGQILRIDLQQRGLGFTKPPTVEISPPRAEAFGSPYAKGATAKAYIFRDGINKGRIERIELLSPGSGYTENEPIRVTLSPPDIPLDKGGQKCIADAIMEYEVDSIEIVNPGTGYASEKPLLIEVDPPPLTARVNLNDPLVVKRLSLDDSSQQMLNRNSSQNQNINNVIYDPSSMKAKAFKMAKIGGGGGCIGRACYDDPVVAYAYPYAEADSYSSFRNNNGEKISASSSGDDEYRPQLPFWSGASASTWSFLSLLPSGVGLSFNNELNRYELIANEDAMMNTDLAVITPGKPIDSGKWVMFIIILIDLILSYRHS